MRVRKLVSRIVSLLLVFQLLLPIGWHYTGTVAYADNGSVADSVYSIADSVYSVGDGVTASSKPYTPTNLVVTAVTYSQISVRWVASIGQVSQYNVYRNGSPIVSVTGDVYGFMDTGLLPSTNYSYEIEAVDQKGNVSPKTLPVTATTMPLMPVVSGSGHGLKAEYFNGTSLDQLKLTRIDNTVDFTWEDIAPEPGIAPQDFSVRWSGKLIPRYSELYTLYTETHGGVRLWIDGTEVIDDWNTDEQINHSISLSLQAGHFYQLRMEYKEDHGDAKARLFWSSQSQSKEIIPQTQLDPPFIPDIPTNITTTATSNSITIAWDPITGASSYDVEADGVITDNGSANVFNHSVTPLSTHTYRIRAKVPEIAGDWSALLQVSSKIATPNNILTVSFEGGIKLTWDPVPGAIDYEVEADGQLLDNGSSLEYIHSGLMPNTIHTYKVRAKSGIGVGDWSNTIQEIFLAEIPTNFKASATTSDSITLTWDGVINATGYDVEVDGQISDNGLNTSYINSGLEPNTSHAYRVRAKTANGPKAWSLLIRKSTLPKLGSGTGLKAEYFNYQQTEGQDDHNHGNSHDNNNDEGLGTFLIATRIDETVDFNWKDQAPAIGVNHDHFSASWTGQIQPLFSETYTIHVQAQGGVRLWIDHRLLIDDWDRTDKMNRKGTITLEAGKRYDIQLEYQNSDDDHSRIKLMWESPSQEEAVIPKTSLYTIGIPSDLLASSDETSVTLKWGAVSFAAGYDIEADGVVIGNVSGTTFVHSNLVPGTLHSYRIRATNGIVIGEWSPILSVPTKLGTTTIQDMTATEDSINVTWVPVTGATAYEIETDGVIVDAGASLTFLHDLLLSGTEHTYRVRAKTEAVTGEWSPIVRKWTLAGIPQNVRTTSASNAIILEWDAVRGATGYDIDVYNTIVDNENLTHFTDSGLNANAQHTYRIRSKNSSGFGKWTSIIAKTTLPSVPGNLNGVATDTGITFSWDASAGATAYDIEADGVLIGDYSSSSYSQTGLLPNTTHSYRVRAKNSDGITAWSAQISVITLPSVPQQLHAEVSAWQIVLTWTGVSEAAGYDIEVDGSVLDNGISTTYTDAQLSPNSEHTYRVRAKDHSNIGQWSEALTRRTLSDVPSNIRTSATSSEITVTWDPAIGAIGYELEVDGVLTDNGLNTTFLHSQLPSFSDHTYRVRAVNKAGAGDWSPVITVTTGLEKPQISIGDVTTSSIQLTWNEVQGATRYELMVDGEVINAETNTQYVHSGLSPNSWHAYRVRALHDSIIGDWSDAVTEATKLGTPNIISLTATSSMISVEWEEVLGAIGYEIEVDGTPVDNGRSTSYLHLNLTSNSQHTYRVRAKNGTVNQWSEWSKLATKSTLLETPSHLIATATTTAITLQWGNVADSKSYDVEIDGQIVHGITGTTYIHQGLEPNTMHTYRVRAANELVMSDWSEQLRKATIPELTINVGRDTIFNFVVVAPKKLGVKERKLIITYNPNELEVLDLSATTPEMERAVGPIKGTDINVSEFSNGRIVYTISNAEKTIFNAIKFMAKSNEYSRITYSVE